MHDLFHTSRYLPVELMPFVLMNAPSTFQQMMDAALINIGFAQSYLDVIVVHSMAIDERITHLKNVFAVMRRYRLKLKIFRCDFTNNKVGLLGQIVSSDSVVVDPGNVIAIQDAPGSSHQTSLRSFSELAGYIRRFIKNFAGISAVLYPACSRTGNFY